MISVRINSQEEYLRAKEIFKRRGISWNNTCDAWPGTMNDRVFISVRPYLWWREKYNSEEIIPLDNLETAINLMLL
jgi:hypothetical protein